MDLRLNGGGQADMVKYISSLFFKERTHINDFYIKRTNNLQQTWTEPRAQSKVWSATPLYILVSAYTASAAEEFAYDMQSLHRAVIVGEITAGAAHAMQILGIGNGFTAWIPFARTINPLTKTDWETRGVQPDIGINARRALDTAILSFYKLQINSADTLIANKAKWTYFIYQCKLKPYKIPINELKKFAGNYGGNKVFMDKGHLIYSSSNGYTARLIPASNTAFTLDMPLDNRELIFKTNAKGSPYEMYLEFNGNSSGVFLRNQNGL